MYDKKILFITQTKYILYYYVIPKAERKEFRQPVKRKSEISIFNELNGLKDRYTKNIINELHVGHPDLQEEIETKIRVEKTNKENDTANKLLKNVNFLTLIIN